ncbi:MAG: HAD family phosphatase [Lachnospiraceae bacterium]|nr:HAD family phosphatase [Lachnospiraceae bacterium]
MGRYRAVFCDIDGTLLTRDHRVTPDTAKKVRELSEGGIPFVLTSSRMPAAIYPIQEEIGFRGPVISYGGGLVLDEDRRPLASIGLSQSLAAELWKEFPPETEESCFCAYSGDLWMVTDRRHPLVRAEEEITSVCAAEGTWGELLSGAAPIHKLWGVGPEELLDETAERLRERFPQCIFCKSAPHLLEIMDGRASKSQAVHILCREWGISPAQTVSFGDNYNDVDMLRAAGHGVAMGNAPEAVKAAASEVTEDNDHEGLLLALNRLFP